MRRMPLLMLLTVLAAASACADPDAGPGRPETTSEQTAPASLLADGTVPWADLRIKDEDLNGKPPGPRTPAPGSKPCRAEQLSGRLASWVRPGTGGETPRGWDAAIGKLIGEVDVLNTSAVECTLQGEVPTTMLAGGREIPMLYTHDINEEGRSRVVAVPAGGHASQRLDWSGPFCQPTDGALELAIQVPHGGGTLRASVAVADTPKCPQGEWVNPNARPTLSASGFTEPVAVSTPAASPLDQLTVSVKGPSSAAAGERIAFRVTLANPTKSPLALDPCPGYLLERFSQGDAKHDAVNTSQLYRLNCRPLTGIPAGGSAVFEMVTDVPAAMASGRKLSITWKLVLPHFTQRGDQHCVLTVTVS
ncbi:hypothetical protein ACFO1B_23785 [Dactylosporangium siamense]|uniref:DUF4232 domain-containing protein n=1 Tax=Dactylosporangium siamense TaxID=685454 RepID=A0A919PP82_9ACTN|nr:hypothetical protein [Dactylosporangium siamense]GIG47222.1 hypothetical protein Dsi01nite_052630 [Dactylosporangium siamense]